MKKTTKNLILTAAFLAVATGVASAQTLKADVPFAFRAGGKMMPAGAYRVEIAGPSHEIVFLRNFEAKESTVMISSGPATPPKAWTAKGAPVLSFECGATRCSLIRLWTGSSEPAITFPHPNLRANERASITDIPLVKATE